MRDSSYGGPRREPGDCGEAPNIAIYYDGSVATVPTLAAGVLSFGGGASFDQARGIGWNGTAVGGVFSLNFNDILPGGSGAKLRACVTSLKKRIRFKCCEPICGENGERISIELQHMTSCDSPFMDEDRWVQPYDVYFQCGCTQTCCQKLSKLVKLINADPNSPAVASVENVGVEWFLYLEAKTAGVDFYLQSFEGLTAPDTIVPNYKQGWTAKSAKNWFPAAILGACDADKCLSAVEIIYTDYRPADHPSAGFVTSNYSTSASPLMPVLVHVTVLFDTAVSNANTARTSLLTLLTGTSEHNKKLLSTTVVADFVWWKFCISRTDAGDGSALTTTRANYTTNVISINRAAYISGKSYYTLISTSATPPTAAGSDVVVAGTCGADDYPCTVSDGCPAPEEGSCIGC